MSSHIHLPHGSRIPIPWIPARFSAGLCASGMLALVLLLSLPGWLPAQEPEEERAETECLCLPMGQFALPEGLSEEMRAELQTRMSEMQERMQEMRERGEGPLRFRSGDRAGPRGPGADPSMRIFMRDGERIRGEARAPRLSTTRAGQLLLQREGASRFGLRLYDLNPELGRYFDAQEGVLVLEVDEEAPLPLEEGDVIVAIDGRAVLDAAHARQILSSYRQGEAISLELQREGRSLTVDGIAP
jgi:hypothetical protein